MKKLIPIILSGAFLFSGIASCKQDAPKLDLVEGIGGDFTLTDQHGKAFNLKDLRGKIVLLFFGYTNCPDVCQITLGKYGVVNKKLGNVADDVKVILVSVDWQRDNPERLKKYLDYFAYKPIGLTGTPDDITKVARLYKALFVKRLTGTGNGYLFDHSTATFLIDKQGRTRHIFGQNDRPDTVINVINVLLKSG